MIFRFEAPLYREGNHHYICIPLNVWQVTGLKGTIPCRIEIQDLRFECKLLPKGKGLYWVPVSKAIASQLPQRESYAIAIEPIPSLTRINHDSPYSKEHPVRVLLDMQNLDIPPGLCGQGCIAMLTGVALEEVISVMGKARASWSKLLEALDYYGLPHASKAILAKRKGRTLPSCCIALNEKHFVLWYKGSFLGREAVDPKETISFVEIFLEQDNDDSVGENHAT